MDLILASTSVYRRRLLERLQLPFRCIAPGTDESALADETPMQLAERLALAKAQAVAREHPQALVIGSDQVASLQGDIMGKPGTAERAAAQLQASAGNTVSFYTGVALVRADSALQLSAVERFDVRFRALTDIEIRRYVELESPLDCAGSFKVEGLGITLFESLQGRDPTGLEGLPLIALSDLLRQAGHDPLSF